MKKFKVYIDFLSIDVHLYFGDRVEIEEILKAEFETDKIKCSNGGDTWHFLNSIKRDERHIITIYNNRDPKYCELFGIMAHELNHVVTDIFDRFKFTGKNEELRSYFIAFLTCEFYQQEIFGDKDK